MVSRRDTRTGYRAHDRVLKRQATSQNLPRHQNPRKKSARRNKHDFGPCLVPIILSDISELGTNQRPHAYYSLLKHTHRDRSCIALSYVPVANTR